MSAGMRVQKHGERNHRSRDLGTVLNDHTRMMLMLRCRVLDNGHRHTRKVDCIFRMF